MGMGSDGHIVEGWVEGEVHTGTAAEVYAMGSWIGIDWGHSLDGIG